MLLAWIPYIISTALSCRLAKLNRVLLLPLLYSRCMGLTYARALLHNHCSLGTWADMTFNIISSFLFGAHTPF